jgi:hypothetical protein
MINAITSYNTHGYHQSGVTMIKSFIEHWPKTVRLIVYLDDEIEDKKLIKADNVSYELLRYDDLIQFKNRHLKNREAHGLGSKKSKDGTANFLFDAVRFSHKVFAVLDRIEKHDTDIVLWLDGDTRTHSKVTEETIHSWCPVDKFASFLGRPWKYTETGFHMFRTKHKISDTFFSKWKSYYVDDSVFLLDHWTDCHTYDAARMWFDQTHWHDLSPPFRVGHPFINGELGKYMDHMKGNRKKKGSSNKGDIKVDLGVDYWKGVK